MKGLKFDFERSAGEAGGLPVYLSLCGDLSDPGETLLKLRALQSFDRGAVRYAIHRTVRCAVRRPLDEVFDDLALHADLVAQRMDSTSLLLDGPGIFISVEGNRKIDYGSCTVLARIVAARRERNEPASSVALAAEMRSITLAALYRLVDAAS
jgi:hypothetical protein